MPRFLAEDHLAISELVRFVIAAISRTDSWEALQADEWSDADLLRKHRYQSLVSLAEFVESELVGEVQRTVDSTGRGYGRAK